MVALGRPGERRPPFGAHRIYAEQTSWRSDIETLFTRAPAIVLVFDGTEGIRWEARQCAGNADLRAKTLFLTRKPGDFDDLMSSLGKDAPALQHGPDQTVLGAYHTASGWRILATRRPTRISYQLAARHVFQSQSGP